MQNRRAAGKTGLVILCWLLSWASMNVSLAEDGFFSFFLQAAMPIAMLFGYLALRRIPCEFCKRPLWILAAFFAAIVTLGASFDAVGSAALVTGQKGKALLYFVGRVPAFYMGMALLVEALKSRKLFQKKLPTWAYALAIFVCWLPYLFAVWPGTVSNDSITQLMEIFGIKMLSNGNPLFQTGILYVFVQLGQGVFRSADAAVAMYVIVQGLLMAWLLGYTVNLAVKRGAPAWLVLFTLLFYALCPVFPLFAWCVGKDTNFAMAVGWFMVMLWRMTRSDRALGQNAVWLTLSAVLCVLLRNAGGWMVAVTLTTLMIWSIVKQNQIWLGTLYALMAVVVVLVIWYTAVIPSLNAQKNPATEALSVPLQQVARVAADEAVPAGDYGAIDAVLSVERLKVAYNGELSDPVKDLWRQDATAREKSAFFAAWLRLGLRYPLTYASALFHNSYGYLAPGYVSAIKPTFLLGAEGNASQLAGYFEFSVNPRAAGLETVLKRMLTYAPFGIACAPGLYGMVTLFAFTVVLTTKRRRMLLCMLPVLLTLIGCLASPVNGYFRYAMPIYLAVPMLLTQTARAIRISDSNAL